MNRVVIVGLDCAEPSLVFDEWLDELPNLRSLVEGGTWGRLRSVVPPITVPAWSCMMSSRTPGDLGIYGFRNRSDHSYDGLYIANGSAVKEPRLWDLLTRAGRSSIVLGVPGTYPVRPLKGAMVSCFLTPSTKSDYTFPPSLRSEVERVVGEYLFDCTDFRTLDRDDLLAQVYTMTDRRFALAEHLLETHPWDLFAMVEMGTDRMHHAFWKDMDPAHRKHDPDGPYRDAIRLYYHHVDRLLGGLLSHVDEDDHVFVVSDHGAKRMDGGVRVNEWLRQQGYLVTLSEPDGVASLDEVGVDWARTTAWAEGGYYSRVFLNVAGREPQGLIAPEDVTRVRSELAAGLAAIPDDAGNDMGTSVHVPEDLYPTVNGIPPDLIVHFGDLFWRAVGTVGGDEGLYTFDNDTGPDDANHAQHGILIARGPNVPRGERHGMDILDVAPTVLSLLGMATPATMRGSALFTREPSVA
ncbi:MAG TPA: alkaline phosphatase family protein [Gaiellaceae bacterium]|nr:alkaline phosphatase family protein [Gaiellaceae bacterium]